MIPGGCFAADNMRRVGTGRRASNAPRSEHPAPRMLVVSNVASFGGGGAVGFRDVILALRGKQPELDLVAVYPWKGSLAAECAQYGARTKIGWIPWWAYIQRLRSPHIEAFLSAFLCGLLLIAGVVHAVFLLARLRPTAVVTNTMVVPSHAIAANLLGIPHYWMVCEFGPDDHHFWFLLGYRRTIRLIHRMSKSVICNSQAVERALLAIEPTMNTTVIYPVVDDPLGAPPERQPGERLRTVLVGYFSQAKGQRLALEAIAIARSTGVDIELALIGAGSQRALRKLARRLGVEDLVDIHGPTRDVRRYWSAAHVGLMCSACEAFGRVTVEAMRAGLPVCGTDAGGTPEIVTPGVNGLLSPTGDASALAANLMALESDEELRRQLALGAIQSTQRFARDRHDDQLAAILLSPDRPSHS